MPGPSDAVVWEASGSGQVLAAHRHVVKIGRSADGSYPDQVSSAPERHARAHSPARDMHDLFFRLLSERPKLATRERVNGSRSKFLRNFKTVGRCPKVTANPQTEISENSYGQAISTPKTRIATWKQKRENQLKTKQLRHRPV